MIPGHVRLRRFITLPAVWGLVRVLPFLCCGLSVLEYALVFLLLFALLHLFPPSLCNTTALLGCANELAGPRLYVRVFKVSRSCLLILCSFSNTCLRNHCARGRKQTLWVSGQRSLAGITQVPGNTCPSGGLTFLT